MSITLSVRHMLARPEFDRRTGRDGPVFVSGMLWLDAARARLHDLHEDISVPVADDDACAAVRAVLPPPGEYLGGAVMQAWVRDGSAGIELHTIYWITLGDDECEVRTRRGPHIQVRPVPAEYDFIR